jgi:IS4 transposase
MAALKADEAMEQADLDAAQRWREVVRRINTLLERPYGPLN